MGFQSNNRNVSNSGPAAASQGNQTNTVGYLNVYVPTKSGGQKKLGALFLKGNIQLEAIVAKHLSEGGEAALAALIPKLSFTFSERNDVTADEIDFGM